MLKRLDIDPEFKSLIPPLTPDEYKQLEENLIAEGCRDKLVVWEDVIIDGHNRYEICHKHGIYFEVKEMYWDERGEAIEWIIKNQLGRRSVTAYVRSVLVLRLEDEIKARAKENMVAGGGDQKSGTQKSANPIKHTETRKELAKLAGVSHDTISKVKVIEEKAMPEQKEALRSGKKKVNTVFNEVKEAETGTRVCGKCHEEKPLSAYYDKGSRRYSLCKVCHDQAKLRKTQKNAKGEVYKISDSLKSVSEAEIVGDLYNENRVIEYTVNDLNESIGCVVDVFCRQIKEDLSAHRDLINDDKSVKKITANLLRAVEAVNEMIGDISK